MFEVFYDTGCPLCVREVGMLRRIDRGRSLEFTPITHSVAAQHDLAVNAMMAEIHGVDAEGNWFVGADVFRRIYRSIGFGALVWVSELPLIHHAVDSLYRAFAKRRLWLTGRRCDGAECVPR